MTPLVTPSTLEVVSSYLPPLPSPRTLNKNAEIRTTIQSQLTINKHTHTLALWSWLSLVCHQRVRMSRLAHWLAKKQNLLFKKDATSQAGLCLCWTLTSITLSSGVGQLSLSPHIRNFMRCGLISAGMFGGNGMKTSPIPICLCCSFQSFPAKTALLDSNLLPNVG